MKEATWVQRFPVYYGWVVWIGAVIIMLTTYPGQSFTVSLFFDYFIDAFSISRTTLSGLYGLGTFIASLSLTWVGMRVDRSGNRVVGSIVAGLLALALVFMSLVFHPVMLLFGFVMIRGLGQGSLGMIGMTTITGWFARHRGRMVSLTIVGFSLGQSLYIPTLESLLERYDWRDVWLILAAVVAFINLPLIWLLVRNSPEDMGLDLDGVKIEDKPDDFVEVNWTLPEARRTFLFWVYLIGMSLVPAWGTGMIIHQISIFEELGYSRRMAANTYGTIALVTAACALGAGFIVDRFAPGKIVAFQLGALMAALGLTMVMTEEWLLLPYALSFGLMMGIGSVLGGSVWPNLFGRLHQGAIRGFVVTGMVIGTSIGPILFGFTFDMTGSYNAVMWAGIIISGTLAIMAPNVSLPDRKES